MSTSDDLTLAAAAAVLDGPRVGVLLASSGVPRWITQLLDDLVSSASVRLSWVAAVDACAAPERVSPRPVLVAITAVDRLLFARRAGLLGPADADAWARGRSVPFRRLADGRSVGLLLAETTELDIVLDLTGTDRPLQPPSAVLSVWRLCGVPVGSPDVRGVSTAVLNAVLDGAVTVTFELEERTGREPDARHVVTGVCPTHPSSPLLTDAYLAASARQLIAVRLENVAHPADGALAMPEGGGPTNAAAAVPRESQTDSALFPRSRPLRTPSGRMPLRAGAHTLARALARQVRKAVWEPQWFLMIGRQSPDTLLPDPRDLEPVLPPPGRYWADPHIVEHQGRVHLFFEEFLYAERRGRIAVSTLGPDLQLGPVSVALDLDSHLSYPHVFVHAERLYMIPEGASSGRVDLYECGGDPRSWAFCRTIVSHAPLVDVSIVEWEGRWWLFGSLKKPPGMRTAELLLLYSTDDPVAGEWRPHRLNPLLADVGDSRPAGAPWRHAGRLYRLAQDGARGYGAGIVLNDVLRMDRNEYKERRVASLRPVWGRRLCGVHTLNRAGDVVVMDACRWVPRDPRRARTDEMLG